MPSHLWCPAHRRTPPPSHLTTLPPIHFLFPLLPLFDHPPPLPSKPPKNIHTSHINICDTLSHPLSQIHITIRDYQKYAGSVALYSLVLLTLVMQVSRGGRVGSGRGVVLRWGGGEEDGEGSGVGWAEAEA